MRALATLLFALFGGCASGASAPASTLIVYSDPPGGVVTIRGDSVGVTPYSIPQSLLRSVAVLLEAPGCVRQPINPADVSKGRIGFRCIDGSAVPLNSIRIGMTVRQVRDAWGDPDRINRTTTRAGSSEQWVYGSSYVYMEAERVTAIQSSR